MKQIIKENLNNFMNYYHELHDSYIKEFNYDVYDSKIELLIDVCWFGELILKDDNSYETNKIKLKMILNSIKTFNIKDYFSWDYIDKLYMKFIKLENKEYICFASSEEEPLIYIVCDSIEYEEIIDKDKEK